jgi:large subunit ribosomal protein L17
MHGRIETTEPKAKELRPIVEKMVSFARRGDLHARRVVLSRLRDPEAVKKLFDEIGPRYVSRPGGYTRILKLGYRLGDNSSVALIEFVQEEGEKKEAKKAKTVKSKAKTTKTAAKESKTPKPAVEEEGSETSAEPVEE